MEVPNVENCAVALLNTNGCVSGNRLITPRLLAIFRTPPGKRTQFVKLENVPVPVAVNVPATLIKPEPTGGRFVILCVSVAPLGTVKLDDPV